jgi:subtilisin-like proprotein convertase family protein/subtilisin family serine protease
MATLGQLSATLVLMVSIPHASASETFTVFESGAERVFQMVSATEVREERHTQQLTVLPRVSVAVATRELVPALAARYGALRWRPGAVGGFYDFEYATPRAALAAAAQLHAAGFPAGPELLRQRRPRFTPADPLYPQQWYLRNRGQRGGLQGLDLNVGGAWQKVRGRRVNIAIVDDGLELGHRDLRASVLPLTGRKTQSLHYDFNRETTNPRPTSRDSHGTAVAGLAAAASNGRGGVGVAPRARLAGLRLTARAASDRLEARALQYRRDRLHIYNNSWGPADDGSTVDGPGPQLARVLRDGVRFGRRGRGSIFVWAGGNGRTVGDDSNYDGYANALETIAVGGISDRGVQTTNSEGGANLVVVAPSSSERRQGLITTDLTGRRGYNRNGRNDGLVIPRRNVADNDYTNDFGDTSGAAPLVSGVVALMLEANRQLGWREVQDILIRTARRVHPADKGWQLNGAGLWFNHKYGSGLVDATAAVKRAKTSVRLGAKTSVRRKSAGLPLRIPDNDRRGVVVSFDLSAEQNLRVEHVQFIVTVTHAFRGDLHFELVSPAGMVSTVPGRRLDRGRRLVGWPFMSVRHWGENSQGVWTLRVSDRAARDVGTLDQVELVVHGTRITRG